MIKIPLLGNLLGKNVHPIKSIGSTKVPIQELITKPKLAEDLTKAEIEFIRINENTLFCTQKAITNRLNTIFEILSSKDYSSNGNTIRTWIYDVEYPFNGGVYIKLVHSYNWEWCYKSKIDKETREQIHYFYLTNGNEKILDIEVRFLNNGKLKSFNSRYHINVSNIPIECSKKRISPFGTRCININFDEEDKIILGETEYLLDLLNDKRFIDTSDKEKQQEVEELKKEFLILDNPLPPIPIPTYKKKYI